MRILVLVIVLSLALVTPMLWLGEDAFISPSNSAAAEKLGAYGSWAWAAGIGLLVIDLVLPIPSTAVMAALGMLYGTFLGGIVSAAGSMLAGIAAYGATRLIGPRAAERLAGREGMARSRGFFDRYGGWAVAISRPMPLLAEVVACLAGMARMPWSRFLVAMACGSVPMGFAFATFGHFSANRPVLAMIVSAGAPLLLWPVAARIATK